MDPEEVRRLLRVSRAACVRRLQAANKQNRLEAKRCAIEALAALRDALALDPSRSAPAWRDGTPREIIQSQDSMIGFYVRYIDRATANGL
jgi:hypothetical protein